MRLPRTAVTWTLVAWVSITVVVWIWIRSGAAPSSPEPRILTWRPELFSLWYSVPMVIPAWLILRAVAREFGLSSSLGRGLALILLGVGSWSFGNAAWFWYSTCQYWSLLGCEANSLTPYPSLADIGYLAMYPLLLLGGRSVGHALGIGGVSLRWGAVLAGLLIVSVVVGLPATNVVGIDVGFGYWIASDAGPLELTMSVVYILGDVLLLWWSVVLLAQARHVASGALQAPLRALAGGITAFYIADITFFHDLVAGTGAETGLSNTMYALAIPLVITSMHWFTQLSLSPSTIGAGRRGAVHEAGDAVVESQARMLGPVAWHIANSVPGVRVDAGQVHLALPYDNSLRALTEAFGARTGHLGLQLAQEALRATAASHPDGKDLDVSLVRAERLVVRQREDPLITIHAAITAGAVLAAVGVLMIDANSGFERDLVLDRLPLTLVALSLGFSALRIRSRLGRRSSELERANESLAMLLSAVDGARREERIRVAGEIHDFALQQIVASLMHIDRIPHEGTADDEAVSSRARAQELLSESIRQLRRIMDGLEPNSLFHRDLPAALQELADRTEEAYGLRVNIDALGLPLLQLHQQLLMFRVISETVTNAGKHSGATSVRVHVVEEAGVLHASVVDDGCGFDQEIAFEDRLSATAGAEWGLRLIVQQVQQEGGRFQLESSPGHGTRIDLSIPTYEKGSFRRAEGVA